MKMNVNGIIPLNAFEDVFPISIDVVYAKPDHKDNQFPNLYGKDASLMWAHKDIASITLLAAKICNHFYGWTLKVNDCLRPVEAQQHMEGYGYHPSLVSLPGSGAHPRAMAIDVEPISEDGELVNMGTAFDYFAEDVEADNPAARNYTRFSANLSENQEIWENRQALEFAFRYAATCLGKKILPLPQEWWDFREEESEWGQYDPLYESDLLPCQRLIEVDLEESRKITNGNYPAEMSDNISAVEKWVVDKFSSISAQPKPDLSGAPKKEA